MHIIGSVLPSDEVRPGEMRSGRAQRRSVGARRRPRARGASHTAMLQAAGVIAILIVPAAALGQDSDPLISTATLPRDLSPWGMYLSADPLVKRLGEALAAKNGEIEALMKSPAPGGPIVNGALPAPHNLRGQNAQPDGSTVDLAKASELREQLVKAETPAEREKVANEMTRGALAALTGVIGGAPRQQP